VPFVIARPERADVDSHIKTSTVTLASDPSLLGFCRGQGLCQFDVGLVRTVPMWPSGLSVPTSAPEPAR
jgi:hypothetical protein